MATVNVTTWAEFVTAVGTSGADVVLPEEAVWDMNEIQPEYDQNLAIACASINGNGTEIKNLTIRGYFSFSASTAVQNLKITNILGTGSGGGSDVGTKGIFATGSSPTLNGVAVSGTFGLNYNCILNGGSWTLQQCAFNLLMSDGCGIQREGSHSKRACRFFLNLGGTSQVWLSGSYTDAFNEFVVNAELAEKIFAYSLNSSTYRGNLQNVTEIYPEGMTGVSVYSTASMPNAVIQGYVDVRLVGVTDAQMKSADYLQSIGFLIGSD